MKHVYRERIFARDLVKRFSKSRYFRKKATRPMGPDGDEGFHRTEYAKLCEYRPPLVSIIPGAAPPVTMMTAERGARLPGRRKTIAAPTSQGGFSAILFPRHGAKESQVGGEIAELEIGDAGPDGLVEPESTARPVARMMRMMVDGPGGIGEGLLRGPHAREGRIDRGWKTRHFDEPERSRRTYPCEGAQIIE